MKEKILLTGAGSLLGKELRLKLKKEYNFFGINTKTKTKKNYFLAKPDNLKSLEKIFKSFKPDIVVHLATYYTKKNYVIDRIKSKKINYLFSKNLISLSLKYEVRKFIYTGSAIEHKINVKNLKNPYLKFKLKFSEYINNLKLENIKKTNIIVLYLSETYSKNDNRDRFIPNLFKKLKKNKINFIDYSVPINFLSISLVSNFIKKIILRKKLDKINKFYLISKKPAYLKQIIDCVKLYRKNLEIRIHKKRKLNLIDKKFFNIKDIYLNDNFMTWFKYKMENNK